MVVDLIRILCVQEIVDFNIIGCPYHEIFIVSVQKSNWSWKQVYLTSCRIINLLVNECFHRLIKQRKIWNYIKFWLFKIENIFTSLRSLDIKYNELGTKFNSLFWKSMDSGIRNRKPPERETPEMEYLRKRADRYMKHSLDIPRNWCSRCKSDTKKMENC